MIEEIYVPSSTGKSMASAPCVVPNDEISWYSNRNVHDEGELDTIKLHLYADLGG